MSKKNIKFVDIHFENFEGIRIPKHRLKTLTYADLQPHPTGESYTECLNMQIYIKNPEELEYSMYTSEPLSLFAGDKINNILGDENKILGRVLLRDIVLIELIYSVKHKTRKEGEEEEEKTEKKVIYVPWGEESDQENTCMKVRVNKKTITIRIQEDSV